MTDSASQKTVRSMRPSLAQRLLAMLVIGVAALAGAGPAAATFLNDAGVHTVDALGPFDSILMSNGTTANVVAGANVMPSPSATNGIGQPGISLSGKSTGNLLGGSIRAGDFTIIGGFGGIGIEASESTVTISGGSLRGGDNTSAGGFGGSGLEAFNSDVLITGGSILGGDHTAGTLTGAGVVLLGNSTATITGGMISQGAIGTPIGSVLGRDEAVVDIWGGFFTGAFRINDNAIFNVFGYDFNFSGISGDFLTGNLADGTPINVQILIDPGLGVDPQFNLLVPEPSTGLLLGLGLATLARPRRRSRN
jgi:hypothetical protein